jgi:hypothetical protein
VGHRPRRRGPRRVARPGTMTSLARQGAAKRRCPQTRAPHESFPAAKEYWDSRGVHAVAQLLGTGKDRERASSKHSSAEPMSKRGSGQKWPVEAANQGRRTFRPTGGRAQGNHRNLGESTRSYPRCVATAVGSRAPMRGGQTVPALPRRQPPCAVAAPQLDRSPDAEAVDAYDGHVGPVGAVTARTGCSCGCSCGCS